MRRFTYVYDFGDYWEHLIKVEDLVLPKPTGRRVLCVAGENACPPEDVGGSSGYSDFLDVLKDPTHEEHADTVIWSGGSFDPKRFDVALVNELLATIET
jgi:hypothetical protein